MADFTMHEAEDVDIRITILDPNSVLGDMSSVTEIVFTACDEIGGVPLITKALTTDGIDIESGINHIIRVHLLQADTRTHVGALWRETRISIGSSERVLRQTSGQNGSFLIKESDTD